MVRDRRTHACERRVVHRAAVAFAAGHADRSSRKWIVTAGITLWCVLTSLSGTARHFWQLFLYRFGVGEGTLSPSAWSLIASYFPRERLSLAIGICSLGITAGIGPARPLRARQASVTCWHTIAVTPAGIPA